MPTGGRIRTEIWKPSRQTMKEQGSIFGSMSCPFRGSISFENPISCLRLQKDVGCYLQRHARGLRTNLCTEKKDRHTDRKEKKRKSKKVSKQLRKKERQKVKKRKEGRGREGKGREGKRREGKGRERKKERKKKQKKERLKEVEKEINQKEKHFTHTLACSETSYRITDVECIARAYTLQLNLTGMVWWLEVRNCARKSFYVLARRIYLFWCSSVRLRKPYSSLKTVGKTTCRFLAQPVAIDEKLENCRYVFTGTLQRLRWPLTAMFPSGPLLNWKVQFMIEKRVSRNEQPNHRLEVLHLLRWSTHTHPPTGGWKIKVRTVKWKWKWREMKMRWRWKWDESYLTRTRRGERNAEGKRKHQHKETRTWPTTGKPWKGKEKEKRRQTETEKDQRRGGRTDAPEPTYHSEPTPTSARAEPNLPGERRTREHMK